MSRRKTGPRQGSDPTGDAQRPAERNVPEKESGKMGGQEQDPKRRMGAFEQAGEHARQQQMSNKD